MRVLITGVAGFIGSQLARALLEEGEEVVGIDSFSSYYDVSQKRSNAQSLKRFDSFQLIEVDLRTAPLEQFTEGMDTIYHQAAQPGVRVSWAAFPSYVENNILVTQRLLEAARTCQVPRLVYASSSSVYGNIPSHAAHEETVPKPHSPYGVTKLAAEQLVRLYGENWGLSTVSLRYFTVYGPRQRPDMAIFRLIDSALSGRTFPLYGNGEQIRDFTFVEDVVRANCLAAQATLPAGTVLNVAGGSSIDMASLIEMVGKIVGKPVPVRRLAHQAGDVERTRAEMTSTQALLGWRPQVALEDGLAAQVEWHKSATKPAL